MERQTESVISTFLTRNKDADLRKQTALLESLDVIEKSTASEYSQVHLVRKPDHTWRLCIDLKNLNDATESMGTWPLQHIPIMIDRVTQHYPRLYGKVDMTSGFSRQPSMEVRDPSRRS